MGHEVTVCPDGLTAVAALQKQHLRLHPGRSRHARPVGHRSHRQGQGAVAANRGDRADRQVVARHGRRRAAARGVRLSDQALQAGRAASTCCAAWPPKRELTHKYLAVKRRLERIEGPIAAGRPAAGHGAGPQADRQGRADRIPPCWSSAKPAPARSWSPARVHDQSLRADDAASWPINCGALPENLIESELFGHRKGSFTGADEHRVGLFEVADGGTLFLDEIGELPKPMQAKLLRVLESGEIRRVGENESFTVDVRVVCATHRDLQEMVDEGEFREDLMFRINTFEIPLPPLRQRTEDIPQLARPSDGPLPAARPARRAKICSRPRRWRRSTRIAGRATSANWPT